MASMSADGHRLRKVFPQSGPTRDGRIDDMRMDNQSLPSVVDYILCALAFAVVASVIVFCSPQPGDRIHHDGTNRSFVGMGEAGRMTSSTSDLTHQRTMWTK